MYQINVSHSFYMMMCISWPGHPCKRDVVLNGFYPYTWLYKGFYYYYFFKLLLLLLMLFLLCDPAYRLVSLLLEVDQGCDIGGLSVWIFLFLKSSHKSIMRKKKHGDCGRKTWSEKGFGFRWLNSSLVFQVNEAHQKAESFRKVWNSLYPLMSHCRKHLSGVFILKVIF